MIKDIIIILGAFLGSLAGNYLWHKRKWRISLDTERKEINLIRESSKIKKVEYLPELDQKGIEEAERPEWIKFIKNLRK